MYKPMHSQGDSHGGNDPLLVVFICKFHGHTVTPIQKQASSLQLHLSIKDLYPKYVDSNVVKIEDQAISK